MTRTQRAIHARLWVILGPVLLIALLAAVLARPNPPQRGGAPAATAAGAGSP